MQFEREHASGYPEGGEAFILEESRCRRSQAQQADARVARAGMGWNQYGRSKSILRSQVDCALLRGLCDRQRTGHDRFRVMRGIGQPKVVRDEAGLQISAAPVGVTHQHEAAGRYVGAVAHKADEHRALSL